jgi:hypothetical protein
VRCQKNGIRPLPRSSRRSSSTSTFRPRHLECCRRAGSGRRYPTIGAPEISTSGNSTSHPTTTPAPGPRRSGHEERVASGVLDDNLASVNRRQAGRANRALDSLAVAHPGPGGFPTGPVAGPSLSGILPCVWGNPVDVSYKPENRPTCPSRIYGSRSFTPASTTRFGCGWTPCGVRGMAGSTSSLTLPKKTWATGSTRGRGGLPRSWSPNGNLDPRAHILTLMTACHYSLRRRVAPPAGLPGYRLPG